MNNHTPYTNGKWREGSVMDSVLTYEQKLIIAKREHEQEREYLRAWDDAIKENYRRIRDKHEYRRMLKELEVEL